MNDIIDIDNTFDHHVLDTCIRSGEAQHKAKYQCHLIRITCFWYKQMRLQCVVVVRCRMYKYS
jgi:hypothetical protein